MVSKKNFFFVIFLAIALTSYPQNVNHLGIDLVLICNGSIGASANK